MKINHQLLKNHEIYLCKVVGIKPTYLILQTKQGPKGICHISEVSDYKVKDLSMFFQVNKWVHFLLLNYDAKKYTYKFSFKRINPKMLKNHSKIIPTVSGFNNLKKVVDDLLE